MNEMNTAKPNESLPIGLAVRIMYPIILIFEVHL